MSDNDGGIYEWDRRSFDDPGEIDDYIEKHFSEGSLQLVVNWLEHAMEVGDEPQQLLAYEALGLLEAATDELPEGVKPKYAELLLLMGIKVGNLAERIQVLDFDDLAATGRKRLEASAKGGRATRTTLEHRRLALDTLSECRGGRVSETEARRRAIARMKKEHDVDISLATIGRIARENPDQR